MRLHLVLKSAALTFTLSALVGCGTSSLTTTLDPSQTSDAMAMRMGPGMGRPMGHRGGEFGLFAGLDLTTDQQAQLRTIADKYRPQPATASATPRLEDLLVAETLDVNALQTALANRPTPPAPHRIDFLVEARAVLTDAQRTTLVERLKAEPAPTENRPQGDRPPHGPEGFGIDRLTGNLTLTAHQQAAYDAFQAKLDAGKAAMPTPPDPQAMHTVLIAFLETGDASGLQALEPTVTPPAFPVDEFLAWVKTLTLDQRKALFTRPFGGPHHGMGPHEGF